MSRSFEYHFNSDGKLSERGEASLHIICEFDGENLSIEKVEGYIQALDEWIDCSELFQKHSRPTMYQALEEQVVEDFLDSKHRDDDDFRFHSLR